MTEFIFQTFLQRPLPIRRRRKNCKNYLKSYRRFPPTAFIFIQIVTFLSLCIFKGEKLSNILIGTKILRREARTVSTYTVTAIYVKNKKIYKKRINERGTKKKNREKRKERVKKANYLSFL